jgi:hypothetical protein
MHYDSRYSSSPSIEEANLVIYIYIEEEMAKICYLARKVGSERKAAGPGFFRTVVKEVGRLT